MKKLWKRTAALLSLGAFCTSMATGVPVGAEAQQNYAQLEMDLPPLSSEVIEQTCCIDETPEVSTYVTLPSSVDLSNSLYFPSVGYQTGPTCSSWASTYYQFTYEANKLNGIVSTPNNTYCPTWTHVFYSDGTSGIWLNDAYKVLKNQGALTYADCPYGDSLDNLSWPTDTEAMLKALETKVTIAQIRKIDTTTTKISSVNDTQLNYAKQLLHNGKILTFSTESPSKWAMKYTTTGEVAAFRAEDSDSGHSMAIVGYDDTIKCDINGNGVIESSETGAFKAVNSWGDWQNGGFIWIMYDALNVESANSVSEKNWKGSLINGAISGTRVAIFDYQSDNDINYLYYINVANNPVHLVGMLTFSTNYRYNMDIFVNKGRSYQANNDEAVYQCDMMSEATTMPYNGTLVVDYGKFDDMFPGSANGFNWYIKLINDSYKGSITNVSYKITDNKGNLVRDFGIIATSIPKNGGTVLDYELLNLQLGDVDYSETLTDEDAQMILSIAVGWDEISDLQALLADYNEDGLINARDAAALRVDLSASEAAEFDMAIAKMYTEIQNNNQTNTMSRSMNSIQYEKYVEIVTELYFEFVQEG